MVKIASSDSLREEFMLSRQAVGTMSEDKGRPNEWAVEHGAIDVAARFRIDADTLTRDQQIARLKALRLAHEAAQPKVGAVVKPLRSSKKPRRAKTQSHRG
ncbi:hypothetical protein FZC33_08335 [Labrys sp. KNU-23]|uniref:hypothetical protein n=1 Tax=Labrys sp. KNU-23 TaxID=2789216 RepID=UPI0011EBE57D|nr:hypothetical protein [Labrys sp. KNU-23]QEN86181.1 hypothetical protein FZC33_08335 [Labrys sp. KNU-23]